MEYLRSPIRIGPKGRLARVGRSAESLAQLVAIMMGTPRRGWRGSSDFGLREMLVQLGMKRGVQLTAVKQMNRAFEDLGIEGVKVKSIELSVQSADRSESSFDLGVEYEDGRSEVLKVGRPDGV